MPPFESWGSIAAGLVAQSCRNLEHHRFCWVTYFSMSCCIFLKAAFSAVAHNSKRIASVVDSTTPAVSSRRSATVWSCSRRLPTASTAIQTRNPSFSRSSAVCAIQMCVSIPDSIIVSTFFGSSILAFGHIQNQRKCKESCH